MTTAMLQRARDFIEIQRQAIEGLNSILDERFERAVELIVGCEGRIVTTGMGKAGLIARKISSTLASTGSPACYVHPGESIHGDLGMITEKDVVLALSHKGQTEEVLRMIPYLKYIKTPIVAMTSNPESDLAKQADVPIIIPIEREACPLNLAPTASTTAMLVLGDTLALVALEARGFTPEDYAILHPGGSLGRRLLLRVGDLMHTGDDNPVVTEATPLHETILRMTSTKMPAASIVAADGTLAGFFTDGDLRRYLQLGQIDMTIPVSRLMNHNPKVVHPSTMAVKALEILREHKIIELPVVDEKNVAVGIIHLHDITRAGIT